MKTSNLKQSPRHHTDVPPRSHRTRRWARNLLKLLIVGLPGCIFAPTYDYAPPEENHPPLIHPDQVRPAQQIIVASGADEIVLSVDRVYDLDDEPELYYIWYSSTLGTVKDSTLARSSDNLAENYGVFYGYDGEDADYRVRPCADELRGRQSETVWFYLTDRNWESVSAVEPEYDDGAFLVSWSWVIDLRDVTCSE